MLASQFKDLGDSGAGLARANQRSRVRYQKSSLDPERDHLVPPSDLPVVGPGACVEIDAIASLDTVRVPRPPKGFDVRR